MHAQPARPVRPVDGLADRGDAVGVDSAPAPLDGADDWMQACLDAFPCVGGEAGTGKRTVGHLVRTIEQEVIPRLAQAHRSPAPSTEPLSAAPSAAEVQTFVARILDGADADVMGLIGQLRRRGMSVQAVYLELLAPAARALGALWDQDLCDFPGVTVALGRLQRLLRELGPEFGIGAGPPRHHHRVLLAQAPHEQHSFGLSMVAEFFRREGWVVDGGVGTAAVDPAARVQADWFDVAGFSIGSHTRLDWLRQKIAAVRQVSRNPAIVVMVGGPLFTLHPDWVTQVGADASAPDASQAPQLAASLIAAATAVAPAPSSSRLG